MTWLTRTYYAPQGGHPGQTELLTGRAVFTEAYAVIPKGVMQRHRHQRPAVLGGDTRLWILSRPLSGFAETFSQYIMEVAPGGGSDRPEPDAGAEGVLFVVEGELTVDDRRAQPCACSRAALPTCRRPAAGRCATTAPSAARLPLDPQGLRARRRASTPPEPLFANEQDDRSRSPMPDTEGRWATTRFVDPADLRHDMHVTIVTFEPGAVIPFAETHVMEHGLYVLEGKAVYRLNQDWVEVEAGDYHVAARLLPAGLLCRRPRPLPLSALQGRQPPLQARHRRR